MQTLIPALTFNGNTEEVLEFYRTILGGTVEIMRYAGTPAASQAPAGYADKVLYGRLKTPGGDLIAADSPSVGDKEPSDNFKLTFDTESESEAEAVFGKLSAGGNVTMPMDTMFWGAKFGMLVDKYGIAWMVNCALEPAKT